MSTAIIWFRQDLRLRDNPALHAAAKSASRVLPVYVWAPEDEGGWAPGAASRWWLHHSLAALDSELRERGSRLTVLRGSALKVLPRIVEALGVSLIVWNRRYEPAAADTERSLTPLLEALNCQVRTFNSALLAEPWDIANGSGKPYRVFTPFRRRLLHDLQVSTPLPVPKLLAPSQWPKSETLESLELLPRIPWDSGFSQAWQPGESGAHSALRRFVRNGLAQYSEGRNQPAITGTSRLSPFLHHGEIGPRQIVRLPAVRRSAVFLSELAWREFAHHLLHHFPQTPLQPLKPEFANFPWRRDARALAAWQKGDTGIPLVDAGMRELWTTGWMHNRVRMVVASFLVKNLQVSWQTGAKWFWDTLVDANLANNTLNWQWVAGSGADAAPYFRVFNPDLQAKRFDPGRRYIGRWAPDSARRKPIVDLSASREAALEAYQHMREARQPPAR